jgi:Domain of unknown function (DUF4440)
MLESIGRVMKLTLVKSSLFAFAAIATLSSADRTHARAGTLDTIFAAHLAAIERRDLEELERTITRDNRLTLILPGGEATYNKAEYLQFHRSFFNEPDWSIAFDEVGRIKGEDFAVITTRSRFTYKVNSETRVNRSWVTFTFAKQHGEWRLVADQNTRLPPTTAMDN